MSERDLPLVIEPAILKGMLGSEDLRVIDISRENVHRQMHLPGAVHLDYGRIVAMRQPVGGLVPDVGALESLFAAYGLQGKRVVAYDDEGGGKASRLIWTLHLLGFRQVSLLNGGLHAWANEGFRLERTPTTPVAGTFNAARDDGVSADAAWIAERLEGGAIKLVDARGEAEYTGSQRFASRGGHIPGAVHWDWMDLMDRERNLRLKTEQELLADLGRRAIARDDEVVVYCQTHHRSSLSYVALKHLGVERVRGYPGSWSDWGNRPELPVET